LREASFTEAILTTTGFIVCSLLLAVVAHLKFGLMAQICPDLLIGQMEAGARSESTVSSAHCARVASDLAKMKSRGMLFWALQRCSILVVKAASENELNAAFATVVRAGAGALLVRGSPLFLTRRRQLVALATRHALLASYSSRDYAEVAGDSATSDTTKDHLDGGSIFDPSRPSIRPRILTRNDFAPSTNSMRTVRDELGTTRVLDGPGKRIGLS
jgi:hypothetical protein